MGNDRNVTKAESGLAQEPLTANLYAPASDELQAAARAKLEDPEALYLSLVRALRRRKGFGILFVQCTPVKGQEIFTRLEKDLPKKRIGRLTLTEPIDNLFKLIKAREDVSGLNVLFIEGIDKSLAPYIKSETGRNDYYKLEVLPPILAHVNRLRENFREQFPHLCLVFVVPPFALKYFMHRAIDFFSWNSGIWRFTPENEQLMQETVKALDGKYDEYAVLAEKERNQKLVELQDLIEVPNQSDETRSQLYIEQSWLCDIAQDYEAAFRCSKEAISLNPLNEVAWFAKGTALSELHRYEEAVSAYDQALQLNRNYHDANYNKGLVLCRLGRYEEAITAFGRSLWIDPNNYEALYSKGAALSYLGRYEEAVTACTQALHIKSDEYGAFFWKGVALDELGHYEEAVAAYDEALRIKPKYHEALINKGIALTKLGRYEEAIATYNKALSIKSEDHEVLNYKGTAFDELGRYEKAIATFDQALRIKPDEHNILHNKGAALNSLGCYDEAIAAYDEALRIKPDKHQTLYNQACHYALFHQVDKALTCLQKAIALSNTDEYVKLAKADTDFDSIRNDPRFQSSIVAPQ